MTTDQTYREMAKEQYHRDGKIEIDDNAPVSRESPGESEDGAYVQAWVWVNRPELDSGDGK